MYIKRLYIDSFGGLSKKEYDFSEGVNIIQGNNESGKSTILSFIKFMLYGAQSKPFGGLSVSERKLFLSWKEGRAAGNMTVEVGGKEYRIERELSIASRVGASENGKEVFRETVEVINTANGAIEITGKNPGDVFLGVSEDVFALTAMVGQISGVRVNGADICTSIEDLLFSADDSVNTEKAIGKLDEARRKLLHKSGKGGDIYDLECEKSALRAKLAEAREAADEIIALDETAQECKDTISANNDRISQLEKLSEASEAFQVSKRFETVHLYENKINEIKEGLEKIKGGDKHDEDVLVNLRARTRDYSVTQQAAEGAKAKLDDLMRNGGSIEVDPYVKEIYRMGGRDAAENEFERHCKKMKRLLGSAVAFLVFAVLAAAGGAAIILLNLLPYGYAYGLFALAAGLLILSISGFANRARHKEYVKYALSKAGVSRIYEFSDGLDNLFEIEKEKEQKRKELSEAKLSLEYAKERMNDAGKAVAKVLEEAGISAEDFNPERLEEVESELETKINGKKTLLGAMERFTPALENALEQVKGYDESEIKSTLKDADRDLLERINTSELRREREFLISSTAALNEKLTEVSKRRAVLSALSGDPDEMVAREGEIERRIIELKKRHDAYSLAEEVLISAGESLRNGLSPKLNSVAREIMSGVTAGKYDKLGIGQDFSMTVESEGTTHEADYLSAGTRDVSYIALRLALMKTVFPVEMPPMLLDESMARLDDTRLSNMLETINGISLHKNIQFIIFTCQKREAEMASKYSFRVMDLSDGQASFY